MDSNCEKLIQPREKLTVLKKIPHHLPVGTGSVVARNWCDVVMVKATEGGLLPCPLHFSFSSTRESVWVFMAVLKSNLPSVVKIK